MRRLAHFALQVTAADPGEPRQRWNGQPLASATASRASAEATEAFKSVLREHGFLIDRTGYGVTASEVPEDA